MSVKILKTMASHPAIPAHPDPCTQERRIIALEEKQSEHSDTLADGRVRFAEIQRDLAQIQVTLAEIKAQLAGKTADWVITLRDAAINWIALAVLGGLFWAVVKSGAAGVAP